MPLSKLLSNLLTIAGLEKVSFSSSKNNIQVTNKKTIFSGFYLRNCYDEEILEREN